MNIFIEIHLDRKIFQKFFRERRERKVGDVKLYLSVMPYDIPSITIKNHLPEQKIVVNFLWKEKETLKYKFFFDEKKDFHIYFDDFTGSFLEISFPHKNYEKLKEFLKGLHSKILEDMEKLEEWDGKTVANLDMRERQIDFLLSENFDNVLKILIEMGKNIRIPNKIFQ